MLQADRTPTPLGPAPSPLKSYFMGGFECSTHRRRDGRRLDVIAATRHDALALDDYRLLQELGLGSVRDGLRWHLIERIPYRYDWSSLLPMLRAARAAGVQVVWDVMHYGWPDGLEIASPAFVDRFARFAGAAARLIEAESGEAPVLSVVNEISFLAWAAGTAGLFAPFGRRRGPAIKRQLVRASLAAMAAVRAAGPGARFIQIDPLIHVHPDPADRGRDRRAAALTAAQYEAWDMLAGRVEPDLGGHEGALDLIGVNYYCHNQWVVEKGPLDWRTDPRVRPLRDLLGEVGRRYGRPVLIAETGIEGSLRAPWLRYVAGEARAAAAAGTPIIGLCLYPVLNHPGWDDERHCPNGLIDYDRQTYRRRLEPAPAAELALQMGR
jgi:beta-glucosidase/6-phospho-beta-glucosidase/beta-galactosidase